MGCVSCIRQDVLLKYIVDVSVPISQPLVEAEASSTSIGVDMDTGSTSGAAAGSVSIVG